jgi:16S rRNA processing protein RimM
LTNTTPANHQSSHHHDKGNIIVGRIRGVWGLRGDLRVEVLTDVPERFHPGSVLYIDQEETLVESVRTSKSGIVVKLDLANDRTKAESLRGQYLTVPEDDVADLPEGSYYHFQIVDMGVWTEQDEYLGSVKQILPAGGADVYVVGDDTHQDVLIPALEEVILKVDLQHSKMVVRLPEGLREG